MMSFSASLMGRLAEISDRVMLSNDLTLLPLTQKPQLPDSVPLPPEKFEPSKLMPASGLGVLDDLTPVSQIRDSSARASAEALTGFAPDVPELLAVIDICDSVSGSADDPVGSCFDLRAQTDSLLLQQMSNVVSSSVSRNSVISLGRRDPRQSSAVQSAAATMTEICTACERLRDALDPRSVDDRLTQSYVLSSKLQASFASMYCKNPSTALAAFGFATEAAFRFRCTASKSYLLLCEAAKRAASVCGFERSELLATSESASDLTVAALQPQSIWPAAGVALRDMINCDPARVNQVISVLEPQLRLFYGRLKSESALATMLTMLAREYRLSVAATLGNLTPAAVAAGVAVPQSKFSAVSDAVYGTIGRSVLHQFASNTCMGAVSDVGGVLTFEDDYIEDRPPGQQFYIDAALNAANDSFDVSRLSSVSSRLRGLASALAQLLAVSLEPQYVPRSSIEVKMHRGNEIGFLLSDALTSGRSGSDPYAVLLAASTRDKALAAALLMYLVSRLSQYTNDGGQFITTRDTSQLTPLSEAAKRALFLRLPAQLSVSNVAFDYAMSQQDVVAALESRDGVFSAVLKLTSELMSNFRAASLQDKTLFSDVIDGDVLICFHEALARAASFMSDSLVSVTYDGKMLVKRIPLDSSQNYSAQQVNVAETASITLNVALHSFLMYAADAASALATVLDRQDTRTKIAELVSAAGPTVKLSLMREQLALVSVSSRDFLASTAPVIEPYTLSQEMMKAVVSVCAQVSPSLVVVGLPYGFMRTVTRALTSSQKISGQSTNDIVKVTVNVRDVIRGEQRSSQSFLFDTRRFVDRAACATMTFVGTAIESVPTARVGEQPQLLSEAILDDAYVSLSRDSAEDIIRNHVTSFCCEALLRITFDADFDETRWHIDSTQAFDAALARALYDSLEITPPREQGQRAPDTVRTTARQIINQRQIALTQKQASVVQTSASVINAVCASLTALSSETQVMMRLFRARKFERVFVIPIAVEHAANRDDSLSAISVSVEGIE